MRRGNDGGAATAALQITCSGDDGRQRSIIDDKRNRQALSELEMRRKRGISAPVIEAGGSS